MKSNTDVFTQKKFSEDIFISEIPFSLKGISQKTFIIPSFQIGLALCARPILKLIARLLPELYSTRSNYYYLIFLSFIFIGYLLYVALLCKGKDT